MTSEASQGQRYWIQDSRKYFPLGTGPRSAQDKQHSEPGPRPRPWRERRFENSVRNDRRVRDDTAARRELGTDRKRFGIVRTAWTHAENRRSLACSFVTAPNK